jgi:hypothetical protein
MSKATSNIEKKSIAFSFSKLKQKSSLVKQVEVVKAFNLDESKKYQENVELITSIEGKQLKSLNEKNESKKLPLIIPCKKNELNFKVKSKNINEVNPEDLEVLNELIADSINQKNKKKPEVILAMSSNDKIDENKIEEPNYEEIGIEQFGNYKL